MTTYLGSGDESKHRRDYTPHQAGQTPAQQPAGTGAAA